MENYDEVHQAWLDEVATVELPQWLQECLPPLPPQASVSYTSEGGFQAQDASGTVVAQGEDLPKLLQEVEAAGYSCFLEKSLEDGLLGLELQGHHSGFYPSEHKGLVSMLLVSDPEASVALLKTSYRDFLEAREAYLQAPEDHLAAYAYLDSHPAFWVRDRAEATTSWRHGLQGYLWWAYTWDEERRPSVMMEAGLHCEPDYTTTSHDLRLDVNAPTFEEGLVQLAALVEKFYTPEGVEREGVEYAKSPLAVQLETDLVEVYEALALPATPEEATADTE